MRTDGIIKCDTNGKLCLGPMEWLRKPLPAFKSSANDLNHNFPTSRGLPGKRGCHFAGDVVLIPPFLSRNDGIGRVPCAGFASPDFSLWKTMDVPQVQTYFANSVPTPFHWLLIKDKWNLESFAISAYRCLFTIQNVTPFLKFFSLTKENSKSNARIAFLNADWRDFQGVSAIEEDPTQSICIDDYIGLLKRAGWEITHIIDAPLSLRAGGFTSQRPPSDFSQGWWAGCRKTGLWGSFGVHWLSGERDRENRFSFIATSGWGLFMRIQFLVVGKFLF